MNCFALSFWNAQPAYSFSLTVLSMAKVYIANGPTRDELVSRVLSLLPVNFATVSGSIEIP